MGLLKSAHAVSTFDLKKRLSCGNRRIADGLIVENWHAEDHDTLH